MTRAELEESGYKRTNYGKCRGCFVPIEWWLTVNERPAPYDLMPNPDSEAVSHYATCTVAERFRTKKKEPQRCTTSPTSQDSLLFSEPSSSSPSSPSSSIAPSTPLSREQPENKGDGESDTNPST
jgi:hypothetical protein